MGLWTQEGSLLHMTIQKSLLRQGPGWDRGCVGHALLKLRTKAELAAYMQLARGLCNTAGVAGAVKHVS